MRSCQKYPVQMSTAFGAHRSGKYCLIYLLLVLLFGLSLCVGESSVSSEGYHTEFASKRQDVGSEAPLYNLVQRRLPKAYHNAFTFTLRPGMPPVTGSPTNVHDAYKVSNAGPNSQSRIVIEAASLSGLGTGLNHYLKYVCQVEMAWSGDRFDAVPATAPKLAKGQVLSGSSFVPLRYYMNVVTYGYSYAFWDWRRWEKELDWMVLNGVNMALAMNGQEYILRQLYLDLGLTDQEISSFLASPAYTPWQRMGNLQGSWGYNNSNEVEFKNRWYETQWVLQKKIIQRMQEFNITAVLPAFNGFVPEAMETKHPNASYQKGPVWMGLPDLGIRVTYIPSTDPMFTTMSKKFMELQKEMYNGYTSHFYLLDLYNELDPPCKDLPCLTQVTSGVMQALKAADPQAVWVMQGWFLTISPYWTPERTKAFFDGIKQHNEGRDAFVFDLHSEVAPYWGKTDGYFGINWGWSMLNNFGGGHGLYGTLPKLLTEPFAGYNHPAKSMRGIGITMEAIDQNEFLYHLVLDVPWHRADHEVATPLDGTKLLHKFIERRYGPNQTTPAMLDAWTKLSQTVWDCRTGQLTQQKSPLDYTPALVMTYEFFYPTKVWYDKNLVVQAWELLVKATTSETTKKPQSRSLLQVSSFRYDLVDVTREVLLSTVMPALHTELVAAYNASNPTRMRSVGKLLLRLIDDTDQILSTHSQFMLGPWLTSARSRASDPGLGSSSSFDRLTAYQDYLEYNARNQITWWGPKGQAILANYASKQWGGLVQTYYRPRWSIFIDHLQRGLVPGNQPFDQEVFKKASLAKEAVWQRQTINQRLTGSERINTVVKGDTIEVAQGLWERWGGLAKKFAAGKRL